MKENGPPGIGYVISFTMCNLWLGCTVLWACNDKADEQVPSYECPQSCQSARSIFSSPGINWENPGSMEGMVLVFLAMAVSTPGLSSSLWIDIIDKYLRLKHSSMSASRILFCLMCLLFYILGSFSFPSFKCWCSPWFLLLISFLILWSLRFHIHFYSFNCPCKEMTHLPPELQFS